MEEISSALSVPFLLGNLIYDESVLNAHVDVSGLELIASKTNLLSEPPKPKLSLVPIGTGHGNYNFNHLDSEANIGIEPAIKEIGKGRDNIELMAQDGIISVPNSEDCGVLEDYEADTKDMGNIANVMSVDTSSSVETNALSRTIKVNNEVKSFESDEQLSNGFVENKTSKMGSQTVFELDHLSLWGCSSHCGKRAEMEDAIVTLPNFLQIPAQMLTGGEVLNGMNKNLSHMVGHFFGVYDGHGGCQVANYCRERIHLALAKEIETMEDVQNRSVGKNWQEQWEKAFLSCFLKVDAEIRGEGLLEPVASEAVGSTAVVAVVSPTHVIVANCGDSRAVLCRGKAPLPLSVDHKPNREDERARIEAAGGKVIQWDGYRVSGVLAMSRSIGDRYLEPYVIAEPEMMFVPRTKEDDCLILASDGLWDVLTNEEVCDVARKRILLWHKRNGDTLSADRRAEGADPAAQDAADYLSNLALRKGSRDNISVIVVDLKAQRKFRKKT
ncbi:Phosphoprotein phosphatase [Bertholletia excelsa]